MPKLRMRRDADGVTVFTVLPEAGPADFVQVLSSFTHEGPTPLVLWDLRQASFDQFTGDELRWMASRLPKDASVKRPAGRSAILIREPGRDAVVTFIRYALLNGYGVALEVFSDADAARAWLHGPTPAA